MDRFRRGLNSRGSRPLAIRDDRIPLGWRCGTDVIFVDKLPEVEKRLVVHEAADSASALPKVVPSRGYIVQGG